MQRAMWIAAMVVAACGDERDDRPPSWSYIHAAIIMPSCATASCHSAHTSTAGLRLEGAPEAHTILVGYLPSGNYIVPGDPTRSKLMYLLRGQDTWRMPPDQPLPEADILLIERWILAGARND